jgi:hypothetical protein
VSAASALARRPSSSTTTVCHDGSDGTHRSSPMVAVWRVPVAQ